MNLHFDAGLESTLGAGLDFQGLHDIFADSNDSIELHQELKVFGTILDDCQYLHGSWASDHILLHFSRPSATHEQNGYQCRIFFLEATSALLWHCHLRYLLI